MHKLITNSIHWVAKKAASSYIAGPSPDDAVRVCRHLTEQGFQTTICPWDNEQDTIEEVIQSYKTALQCIINEKLDCYLSIKAPSIQYNLSLINELIDLAKTQNIRIHFDAMAPDTVDPTFDLLEKAVKIYPHLGYTLPASWQRSLTDVDKIIDLNIAVRIVKGQWTDPDNPNIDSKLNYLQLVNQLAGRATHVAIATHDPKLATQCLNQLIATKTSCELEQLYGLPNRNLQVAKPLNIPVRIYVPYGQAYLSYSLGEMKKRPVIMAWLVRDFLHGMTQQ
jgi:proline dehydrogenase